MREIERLMKERGVRDPEAMYKVAQAYALLGDKDSALRMLDATTLGGFFCYDYFANDPLLNSLHGSAAFSRTLERARERQEQFARRFSAQK